MDVLLDSLNGFLFTGGPGWRCLPLIFPMDLVCYVVDILMSGADLDPPAAALRVLHRSRELFKEAPPGMYKTL